MFGVGAVPGEATTKAIPLAVRVSFYIGSVAFFGAVIWTVLTTQEYPPDDMEAFTKMKAAKSGVGHAAVEIFRDVISMPKTMRRLAWVQIFTWLGLFCMWLYFGVAVARNVFGGSPGTPDYNKGIAWGGNCFAMYSVVCFAFSFVLAVGRGAPRAQADARHLPRSPAPSACCPSPSSATGTSFSCR